MIETSDENGVAVLRLAHGPVNALDLELLTALPRALDEVADAPAVVLTGAGRCFSAGVDLKRIVEGGPEYVAEFLPALSRAALALFTHPRPVVAAVNGHALAGGCVLAAASDHRVMGAGTIGLTELAAGVPFPAVPLEIMRHAVGHAAESMVLTGKPMEPAAAMSIGLVHERAENVVEVAVERAVELAAAPREVYSLSKAQLRRPALDRITAATDDTVVRELWSSAATRDRLRGFLAALGKR